MRKGGGKRREDPTLNLLGPEVQVLFPNGCGVIDCEETLDTLSVPEIISDIRVSRTESKNLFISSFLSYEALVSAVQLSTR